MLAPAESPLEAIEINRGKKGKNRRNPDGKRFTKQIFNDANKKTKYDMYI